MARGRTISIFLRITLACSFLVLLFGTIQSVAHGANFGVGDAVEVTTNLNVRTGPGTSYPEITDPDYHDYAPAGTRGEVVDGPSSADGYTWWQVNFGPGLYSGWSVEGGLEKVASTVSASINSYSPSSLVEVTVGDPTGISVTFTNTGDTAWNFIAGATVWDSGGSQVANYSKTLSSALQPGQQATVNWAHSVSQAGDYWLQFGVWKATPYTAENLLDKKPSPSQNLIRGMAPVNQPPTCSVTANPSSGDAPLNVTFSLSASDPDGSITAWVLDVNGDGDADYSGTGNPPSTISHTYNSPGGYSVVLMVSDNDEASANDTESVNVGSTNNPPNCTLSANPNSGTAPLMVTFSISANDPDGSVTTWVLDADGNGSTDYSGSGNPPSTQSHTYETPGNYTAVLMISDNDDATASDTAAISVSASGQPVLSCSPASFSFSAAKNGANPNSQNLSIWNSDEGTLSWTVSDDASWFAVSPTSGSSTGEHDTITVSVNIAGMDSGVYQANITLSASGATNSPQAVPVMLIIEDSAQPDLVIDTITWSPQYPSVGNTVTFTVTMKNQGGTQAGSSYVYYFIDGVQYTYDSVYSINPGASTPETFTWKMQEGVHTIVAVADYRGQIAESNESNNEKTISLSPTLSDLIVQSITWAPEHPSIGDTVTFTVTIKNQGNGDAASSKVYYFVDESQQGYDSVYSLNAGETTTETFTWTAEEGAHTIRAVSDYTNVVPESDESNNEKTITYSATALPDLIIQSIDMTPEKPEVGDSVTFTVTVINQGTGDAGSSKVYYFIDNNQQDYDTVYALSAGSTTEETFSWIMTEDHHVLRAFIDYENEVPESDEENNEKTVTIGSPDVSVEINSYLPATPLEVKIGETVDLGIIFTNTGNAEWTLYAAASLRRPDGTEKNLQLKPVSLASGEQGNATWSYTVDREGDWDIVFGIWKEGEQINSLGHSGWLNDYIICTEIGHVILTQPVHITPAGPYSVGDDLTATFTVKNTANIAITLDKLLLGGRFGDGELPTGGYPDFTYESVTLQPGDTHRYEGTFTIPELGSYHFFVAYYMENPAEGEKQFLDENNWNTAIELDEGLSEADRIRDIATDVDFHFSLSASPISGEVARDDNVSTTVTATLTEGTTQLVSFSITGLPSSVTANALPSDSPTISRTLTFTAASNAVLGTHTIRITATGGGVTQTASYYLTVVHYDEEIQIFDIEPSYGIPGDVINIKGANFSKLPQHAEVMFGGERVEILSRDTDAVPNEIAVDVPALDIRWQRDKTVEVYLAYGPGILTAETSNKVKFTYKGPELVKISPPRTMPGRSVSLTGDYFGDGESGGPYFVKFGAERFDAGDEKANWSNGQIVIEAPASLGLGGAKEARAINAMLVLIAIGKSVGWGLVETVAPEIVDWAMPSYLKQPIPVSDDDEAWLVWVRNFVAEFLPGFEITLAGDLKVKVTVTTPVGESEPLYFTFTKEWVPINGELYWTAPSPDIMLHGQSPAEFRIYDSDGRVTGLVEGELKEEIPNSLSAENTILIFDATDSYRYEVVGTDEGTYGLNVASIREGKVTSVEVTDAATSERVVHRYTVDWDALRRGEPSVGMQIDSDGDKVFEETKILQPPIASFVSSPISVVTNEEIDFNASESSDVDGEIVSYKWNFGDRTASTGRLVTHAYSAVGEYTVVLAVIDNDGLLSTYSAVVQVEQGTDGGLPVWIWICIGVLIVIGCSFVVWRYSPIKIGHSYVVIRNKIKNILRAGNKRNGPPGL